MPPNTSLEFIVRGLTPRILFLSGVHGDEFESSRLFRDLLTDGSVNVPTYFYIPVVSPSAVLAGTRRNAYGHDMNREFLDTTTDAEAREIMQILKKYRFDLAIDIHEDPDRSESTYIYDNGVLTDKELGAYRDTVHGTGARLYTGIDDVEDEHLGLHVEKGYISMPYDDVPKEVGFALRWLSENGIVKRGFTLEVPGKASGDLKRLLLTRVISFLCTL